MAACGEPKRLVGMSGSGAWNLLLRSGTLATMPASILAISRRGAAGAFITFCSTVPRMKSSEAAMCSIHSAMDHLSGAGLKFHCASLSPLVAASTPFLLLSSNVWAFSLSAALASCARAVPATAKQIAAAATAPSHLRRFMCDFPFAGSLTARRRGALGNLLGSQVFQMTCNIPVISPSIHERAGTVAVELVGHGLQLRAAVRQTASEDRIAVLHIKVVADGTRSPGRAAFA